MPQVGCGASSVSSTAWSIPQLSTGSQNVEYKYPVGLKYTTAADTLE
eukprot:CAMPEP_0183554012 /NCGR_PEP_ID=MMETSP0371-20130417/76789_1 /TAXON_ID=268820 /ORGANISM="Peridinium aciculiferum, Strain PAER-2" /LENGTH=46 /DNA_ID= /DNA_START= /DNA_END= /DNA_ORIENTATION=